MTEVVELLAVQAPGGHLWGQLIRPIKLIGMAQCLREPRRSNVLTPAAGADSPAPCAAQGYGWSCGQGLLCSAGQMEASGQGLSLAFPHAKMEDLP